MAAAATDRALFDKSVAAAGVPAPEAAAIMPEKDTRVPPERIWEQGARIKATKAAQAAEAAAPAAPEVAPEPERGLDGKFTNGEKQQAAFDDAKYELARNALSRSGWKKKELDAMDESELLKRGMARAKVLEKDDEAHRLAKEAKEARTKTETTGKSEEGRNPPQITLPDTSKILAPLRETLALDEAGAKTLKQTFDEFASVVSQAAVAPLQARLEKFEAAQAQAGARSEQELIEAAREEVGMRFPDLRDPDTFEKVVEDVRLLVNRPKYQQIASLAGRVNACFVDACKLNELQPAESDSQVRDAEKAQRRASGSSVGDRARPAAVSAKDKDRELFDRAREKAGLD